MESHRPLMVITSFGWSYRLNDWRWSRVLRYNLDLLWGSDKYYVMITI
jgi:hypothetical protein